MFPLKCQKLSELKTTSATPELLCFHITQGWKEFSILINWRIKISIQLRCRVSFFLWNQGSHKKQTFVLEMLTPMKSEDCDQGRQDHQRLMLH